MDENLRFEMLRLAKELDDHAEEHLNAVELKGVVFSSEPFAGHVSDCEACQKLVLDERARNPLWQAIFAG